jgi:gliding motility-associated-like protein
MTWSLEHGGIFSAKGHEDKFPGFRGFNLNGPLQCASPNIQFLLDFSETLPSCGAQKYWLVFDSAQDRRVRPCPNDPTKTYIDYGFDGDPTTGGPVTNDSGWASAGPDDIWTGFPFFGHYWYLENDFGCKTIGVRLKSGSCIETAWYHNYICFERLDAEFHAEQITPTGDSVLQNGHYVKTYNAISLGNSTNFMTNVCGDPDKPGISITLRPRTIGLNRVTTFQYFITRREFGDFWYYHKPFWPDTANVSAYCHITPPGTRYDTAWGANGNTAYDTVRTVKQNYLVADSAHVYVDFKNNAGLIVGKVKLKNLLLTQPELDQLNSTGSVKISNKDSRVRFVDGYCSDTIVTIKADALPVGVIGKVPELDLASKNAIDTFFLPYPGFYSVQTFVTNMDGCYQGRTYDLVYGHYAMFWVQNKKNGDPGDSTICVGDTIRFSYKVRYWSNNCPPPAGGGNPPEGCIDGAIGGYSLGGNPYDVFHPWDTTDVITYRKVRLPSWNNKLVPHEKLLWNFGDATGYFGSTGVTPFHVYHQPGSYTITMRTVDSTGCIVDTRRYHLLNVIQIKAALAVAPLSDTATYCAPKSIKFVNNSQILGGPLKIPHKRVFAYTEKRVSKDCKRLELDTVIVDSLKRFTWYRPDGSNFVRPDTATVTLDFEKNGKFDVSLQAEANYVKCKDIDIHPGLIHIVGPTPSMALRSKHAQCFPYTVQVANLYAKEHGKGNVKSIQYNVLDSTKDTILFSFTPGHIDDTSSAFVLPQPYTHGHFRIQIVETDTFHDPYRGTHEECAVTYPAADSQQIYFTIFPHDSLKITGDTLLCVGKASHPGHWIASGKLPQQYDTYIWDMGDGFKSKPVLNDSTFTYAYNDSGRFTITLTAKNSKTGCSNISHFHVKAEKLFVNFTTDSVFQQVAKFTFHNHSINGVQYIWDFGDSSKPKIVTTDTLKPIFHEYTVLRSNDSLKEGSKDVYNYTVKLYAISKAGCVDTFTKIVTFYREFKHYNVFTPNGDGQNDKFVPGIGGETSYSLDIYDRWGNKVYESNASKVNWDGKDIRNGNDCPTGTYYYVWKFKLIGGFEKTINGTVTLLRD